MDDWRDELPVRCKLVDQCRTVDDGFHYFWQVVRVLMDVEDAIDVVL